MDYFALANIEIYQCFLLGIYIYFYQHFLFVIPNKKFVKFSILSILLMIIIKAKLHCHDSILLQFL